MWLRQLGQEAGGVLGIPTLPVDITYNPERLPDVASALVRGLRALQDASADSKDLDTFARIVRAQADPLLVMPVWNALREAGLDGLVLSVLDAFAKAKTRMSGRDRPSFALPASARVALMEAIAAPVSPVAESIVELEQLPIQSARQARRLLQDAAKCGALSSLSEQIHMVVENLVWSYGTYFPWAVCKFKSEFTGGDCEDAPQKSGSFVKGFEKPTAVPVRVEWTPEGVLRAAGALGKNFRAYAWEFLKSLMECDYAGSAACQTKGEWSLGEVATSALFGSALVALVAGPLFGMAPIGPSLLLVMTLAAAAVLTYGMPLGCLLRLPPALPVCVLDDAFDAVGRYLLPRQITWPEGLVVNATRTGGELVGVTDCAASPIGMSDGIHWLAWAVVATHRRFDIRFPAAVWDLVGADAYAEVDVLAPEFMACASLTWPNALPLVMAGVASGVTAVAVVGVVPIGIYQLYVVARKAYIATIWTAAQILADE
jgi:hypothetical protein